MILIPAGWFWMGSEGHYTWESPRHRVFLDAFRISPTTVTRREYQTFLEATGHDQPAGWTEPEFADADTAHRAGLDSRTGPAVLKATGKYTVPSVNAGFLAESEARVICYEYRVDGWRRCECVSYLF